MKKQFLQFSIAICLSLSSCGGKNDEKKETENETTIEKPQEPQTETCGCNELKLLNHLKNVTKKDSDELYNGNCIDKDQNDSIIRKVEIKNGFVIRDIGRFKVVKNQYITLFDKEYQNAELINGYTNTLREDQDIIYVSSYEETKNKQQVSNGVFINYSDSVEKTTGLDEYGQDITETSNGMSVRFYGMDSKGVKDVTEDPTGCLNNFEKFNDGITTYFIDTTPTKSERNNLLKCLKNKFPHFNYWAKN